MNTFTNASSAFIKKITNISIAGLLVVGVPTVIYFARDDYIRKWGVINQIKSKKYKKDFPHLESEIDLIPRPEFL